MSLASFVIRRTRSAQIAAGDAIDHGEAGSPVWACFRDAWFWFEAFQKGRSELLSTTVPVVLSIFLRQPESPASKPASASYSRTGGSSRVSLNTLFRVPQRLTVTIDYALVVRDGRISVWKRLLAGSLQSLR